ncbi:MAG: hypothetical protein JO266_20920 [Acidobacteria bacterium]|nr:hypothetical protein [Acidobacteriota bacterium]MBV9483797.1 hypothetical protein [Acidobacteriota bacterium]
MSGGEAIALKVGVQLITRVAPTGMAWVTTWLRGKKILIVGQPRAGKTSFVDYFQYGTFATPNIPTDRTTKIVKTAGFRVVAGKNERLQIQIKHAIDTIGQVRPGEHAENFAYFKPHALIVMLDLTSNWEGDNEYSGKYYLQEFSSNLSEKLRERRPLRKVLSSIVLVLNKKDLVSQTTISDWTTNSRTIMDHTLESGFGPRTRSVRIIPCSLIQAHDNGESADHIIQHLALSLR